MVKHEDNMWGERERESEKLGEESVSVQQERRGESFAAPADNWKMSRGNM